MFHYSFSQTSYSVENSKKILGELCVFNGSSSEIDKILTDLYVACELHQLDDIDSLYTLAKAKTELLKTPLDSAFFYFGEGYHWVRKSDYNKAQLSYNKAGIILANTNREAPELYVNAHIANLSYYMKRVSDAHAAFVKISEHDSCDTFLKAKMMHNVGVLQLELDGITAEVKNEKLTEISLKEISEYLDQSISMNKEIGHYAALSLTYSVYVNIKLLQDKTDEAMELVHDAEEISKQINDQGRLAFLKIKKAMILDAKGSHQASADTAFRAVEYFRGIGNFDQEIHALSMVKAAYSHKGNHKKAEEIAMEMYDSFKDNFNQELSDNLSKYEELYESQKKELVIQEQAAVLEQDRLKLSNRNRLLGIFGFGIISIAMLMLFLLQKSKRKAQEERDAILIQGKEEGLKNIINAQEEERKRIAKDLHDGIVQQLGGLKLGFQKVLGTNSNPEAKKLISVLDESAQELRELSHKMMPKALSELGLIPALTDMLENSLGHTEIKYEFENFGIEQRLKENIEITVYRIAQELINNITKHSFATHVNIQLFRSQENVILIVEDNGKGFDINSKKNGIGLMNISSRLDTVHGKVNFDPSPESGTLVTVKIPIEE